jgi:hypothetical protein
MAADRVSIDARCGENAGKVKPLFPAPAGCKIFKKKLFSLNRHGVESKSALPPAQGGNSMKKTVLWTAFVCCLVALAANAHAQKGKPGLWEVTTSMSMPGMPQMPGMGARTSQVCVTQAMIDKYGGPYSNPQRGNCTVTNVSVTATGMTANLTCTGQMNMTGTVQMTIVDANTTKTTVQMNGTSPNGQQMNMTTQSTAVYKGADCGSVKPLAMPPGQ